MHTDKLTGMLLDAHIIVKTIDIVPLLYSPKMVRLPSPSSRLAQRLQLTQLCTRGATATGQYQGGEGGPGRKPRQRRR